ncbi:copper resistance protein CopC [Psychrobacillus sp. FSL H8-0484]|uniref:copper resistance CopC family protein n=1 Tax=Psychrobacillus sp. FSL H8-0484 TaxID=2921390 RepID=UPI0030F80C2B
MKKIGAFVFLLLITFAPSALAHSGLETSIPQDGEVMKDEISTLLLTFNTRIEGNSTFKISPVDGQEIPLEELQVREKEMVGSLKSPLENGKYTVTWKIIGEDGHPIENSYSFTVDTLSNTNTEVSSEPIEKVEEKSNDIIQITKEEAPSSNNILVGSLILFLLIALGSTFWLLRREKK